MIQNNLMVIIHFKCYVIILSNQIHFLSLFYTMEIQSDIIPFFFHSKVHRNNVWKWFIMECNPAYLTFVHDLSDCIQILYFSVFSSHKLPLFHDDLASHNEKQACSVHISKSQQMMIQCITI